MKIYRVCGDRGLGSGEYLGEYKDLIGIYGDIYIYRGFRVEGLYRVQLSVATQGLLDQERTRKQRLPLGYLGIIQGLYRHMLR